MKTVNVPVPPTAQRKLDAQQNALLQQLMTATPSQIDAWLTGNVTTLAQARTVLSAMLLALRYLYLRDHP